jgi:hypothetical protein
MATSGSIVYNLTRDQIIKLAFQHLNIYAPGETIRAADNQYASDRLNMMVKAWESDGIHQWKKTEATLFLENGEKKYIFPTAHATEEYGETTLSVAASSGSTSLTVVTTTEMAVNDYIGIVLDDDTLFWTQIATIPTSTTLTIDDALTDDAASGAIVYNYTTKIDRPLMINSCRRNYDDQDLPMWQSSYKAYMDLPNKDVVGTPVQWTFQPLRTTALLYIWQPTDDMGFKINFTYQKSFETFLDGADDPDFPQEWLEALVYNLAFRIAPRYGRVNVVSEQEAERKLQKALSWDNEEASMFFQPTDYPA